jgi:hypothetical protein
MLQLERRNSKEACPSPKPERKSGSPKKWHNNDETYLIVDDSYKREWFSTTKIWNFILKMFTTNWPFWARWPPVNLHVYSRKNQNIINSSLMLLCWFLLWFKMEALLNFFLVKTLSFTTKIFFQKFTKCIKTFIFLKSWKFDFLFFDKSPFN